MAGENSFDARYGPIIRSDGIAGIPMSLLRYQADLGINPQECWLLIQFLSYRWTPENPYPSLRTIAADTNVTRSSLQSYLRSLKEKGYVRVIEQLDESGRQTSSSYDLDGLFDRLEQLIRERGRPSRLAVVKPKYTDDGLPASPPGQTGWPKEDPPEEEQTKEEISGGDASLRQLALMIAVALKRPGLRDDVAQKLLSFAVPAEKLDTAVHRALAGWNHADGEQELWRQLRLNVAS